MCTLDALVTVPGVGEGAVAVVKTVTEPVRLQVHEVQTDTRMTL